MPKLNWDDLRIFLAVARTGRNAAAAARLNLDHTTVTRRVAALESAIDATLVHRSPRGIALTASGHALMEYAERIEHEVSALTEDMSGTNKRLTGCVRLATPEAFGSYLVAPHVSQFLAKQPGIELELVAETRAVSLSNREAEIAVVLSCPKDGRAFVQKLTDYQLGLYASHDYLAGKDPITEVEHLSGHAFVWYIDDLISLPQLRYLQDIVNEAHVVFHSTSISAQQNAVATGTGIGVLHSFAAAQDPRLVRILPEKVSLTRSYWITIHPESRSLPRVRAVIDFLHELVNEHGGQHEPAPRSNAA